MHIPITYQKKSMIAKAITKNSLNYKQNSDEFVGNLKICHILVEGDIVKSRGKIRTLKSGLKQSY